MALRVAAPAADETDELDELELAERAARGDHRAFSSLYRAHADTIYGLITRLVGPCAEREDLMQETFTRFHRALPKYRREASVATFLHSIAVRVARDHLRASARRHRPDDSLDELVAPDLPPEQWAEIGEVLCFLDTLSPDQRIAFVLREVLDYTYPDIAKLVGCFATTARMRVAAANRVLDQLRRQQ